MLRVFGNALCSSLFYSACRGGDGGGTGDGRAGGGAHCVFVCELL